MPTYTIDDMAEVIRDESGAVLSPRTIRYYIAEGVLRRPDERGKFSEAHLDRLRLILRLKQTFLPIPEIREKLQLLSDADVAAELDRYEAQGKPPASNLAADYTKRLMEQRGHISATEALPLPLSSRVSQISTETWEHIALAHGIEIHVRQPISNDDRAFLTALLDYAGKLHGSRT